MASAPTSRITPDIEKKYLEAPMKSKRHSRFLPPAPSAEGLWMMRELPIVVRIACVAITAVNSETKVPMPEREGEALDVGGGEHEQDERGHDRHHVRVDDRGQALLVTGDDALPDRATAADLLLDAFEDDDVGVGGHADRQDQTRDAREGQRDRDQLDQRVEVQAVHEPARRPRSGRARGSRRSGTPRRRADRPDRRPGPECSACLPSVADTCDSEISLRLIGSAPSRSSLARSWAELIEKLPLMSAPLSPLIPSGYCL